MVQHNLNISIFPPSVKRFPKVFWIFGIPLTFFRNDGNFTDYFRPFRKNTVKSGAAHRPRRSFLMSFGKISSPTAVTSPNSDQRFPTKSAMSDFLEKDPGTSEMPGSCHIPIFSIFLYIRISLPFLCAFLFAHVHLHISICARLFAHLYLRTTIFTILPGL